jgi:hypothetical protein
MPPNDTQPPRWIGWITLPIGMIAAGVSMILGDMLFICLKYGRHAYFDEGLRFIKHKPYTLSNGLELSQDMGSLVWIVSVAIWLAIIVGTVAVLVGISKLLRGVRKRRC